MLRPQRNGAHRLNLLSRAKTEIEATRERRQHQDSFQTRQRLGDTDPCAPAKRKIRESRTRVTCVRKKPLRIETFRIWEECLVAMAVY